MMLGKLIKNDIKTGLYTVANVYFAAFVAIAFMMFGVLAKSGTIKVLSSVALSVIMVVILVFTFFAVISMFNKSVYGNVGYLTLTLPVKEWQIVFSKTLTGILFILISYISFITSNAFLFVYILGQKGMQTVIELWQQMEIMGLPSRETLELYLIMKSLTGLIAVFFTVSSLIIAVSLVNVSGIDKFGTIGSILIFALLTGFLTSLANKIGKMINLNMVIYGKSVVFTFSNSFVARQNELGAMSFELSRYFFLIVFSLCLCAAATFLIKKRVNVK
ncbi:MAG: hypothetical protein BWY46_00234 [Firmicutes bacterium ADurb.Bin300]|nr:MAG: hypothetical protein BWY46_00234 [Firmicutes bacterium ADurb.Bin300]